MMFHNKFKKPITKSTVSQEEQEIKKILNTEYYGLLHDLMMNGNIENIIQNNPKRLKEVDDLKRYLEYTDILIDKNLGEDAVEYDMPETSVETETSAPETTENNAPETADAPAETKDEPIETVA